MANEVTGKEFGVLQGTIVEFIRTSNENTEKLQESVEKITDRLNTVDLSLQNIDNRLKEGDEKFKLLSTTIDTKVNSVTAGCAELHDKAISKYIKGKLNDWKIAVVSLVMLAGSVTSIYIAIKEFSRSAETQTPKAQTVQIQNQPINTTNTNNIGDNIKNLK
jgi:hypothetical protein